MNFFDKLPTITYNNMLCKNLLARAVISTKVREQKEAFYPYVMDGNDRMDIVSNDYYNTPGYTWLIWMTNNIIDPYFGTPLSEFDLTQHIIKKYGSQEAANRKIKCYRSNWYDNVSETLTPDAYNGLSSNLKKYYEPVLDVYMNLNHYHRKREDLIVNTNRIVGITISNPVGSFIEGEEIQTDGTNYGFVTYSTETTVTAQHITGTFTGTITGQESGATATVDNVETLTETIAYVDVDYWAPVSFYEFEIELNEMRKSIKLLDPRFAKQAENDLKRIMNSR